MFRAIGGKVNAVVADATAQHTRHSSPFSAFTFPSNGLAAICVSVRATRF
jgi:hypothetical protein